MFFGIAMTQQQQDDAKRRNSWDFFNFENTLNDVGIEPDRRGQEDIASMLKNHMQTQSRTNRSLTSSSMGDANVAVKTEPETGFFCG